MCVNPFEDELPESPFAKAAMRDGHPPHGIGSLSKALWEENQDLAAAALFHPFVLALGQGTLPRSAFQNYALQDSVYLRTFSRGYEVAAERCSTSHLSPESQAVARSQLLNLRQSVEDEIKLHEKTLIGWGFDPKAHVPSNPATAAYVDFLSGVASNPNETTAGILASMMPCMRLYAYIGCTLADAFPAAENHPFYAWLITYQDQQFLHAVATAERLLDSLAPEIVPPEDPLRRYYRTAMAAEVDFFAAQPFSPPHRTINLLVVDFDDTCTTEETTGSIVRAAVAARASATETSDPAAVRAEGEAKLQELVRNYLARRDSLLEEILPEAPMEDELEEFDMTWLGDFLDRLSDFDREMNSLVIDSGVLAGVQRGALAGVGAVTPLRPGCLSLLKKAVEAHIPTAVISVNWSGEMVAAALAQQGLPVVLAGGAGGSRAGVEGAPPPIGAVVVYCNELEYFGEVSTGGMRRRCECATDKGRIFDDLLLGMAADGHAVSDGVSVFVGDSMTDVPALISADAGVILGSNRLIRQVATVAGIPLKPLIAFPVQGSTADLDSTPHEGCPVLYEASSWADIEAFLFAREFKPPALRERTARELSSFSSGLAAGAHPPRVLSIAGSDSGGGAGIQADIKTCAAYGVFSTTAVTALTVQDTHGVAEVHVPPAEFLRAQMRAVLADIGADAVKTGMLPSVAAVEAIADELASLGAPPPLVVDPVLVATSGDALAESGVAQAVLSRLFPLATVVTPNAIEAAALVGGPPIMDVEGMRAAAVELHAFGPQWVLVKGGHVVSGGGEMVDVLYDGRNFVELRAPYIETENTHGTGCTLAAAITAELAKGSDIPSAVSRAKKYVWRTIERSVGLPLGTGQQRPMNHSFKVADWRSQLERQAARARAAAMNGGGDVAAVAGLPEPSPRIANAVDLRCYAVTDPAMIQRSGLSLAEAVGAAVRGGATVVQIREKRCDGGEFAAKAAAALAQCRRAGVMLLVNDRVDVAMAVGADGVHVGQDDLPVDVVRRLMGPDAIIGVSVKTPEEACAAQAGGADYLGTGAIKGTATKDSSIIGVEGLKRVCEAVNIPVVAIGGVGVAEVEEVMAVGASGVAVVSAIFAAKDMEAAAREVRAAVANTAAGAAAGVNAELF